VTRIPPELHRRIHLAANLSRKSLNAWVTEQLQSAVARVGVVKKVAKKARPTGK
jgi:predicted HicB family RNase H-like nuclease